MKNRNRDKLSDIIVIIVPGYSFEEAEKEAVDYLVGSGESDLEPSVVYHRMVNQLRHDTDIIFPKRGRCSWNHWATAKRQPPAIYKDVKLRVLWELQASFGKNHHILRVFREQIKHAKHLDTDAVLV